MQQNPNQPFHTIFLFLVLTAFSLNSCSTLNSLSPKENEPDLTSISTVETNKPATLPTMTATASNLPIQSAKFTLEIETFGSETLEGLTMTHGPFNISIPLEANPTGLVGHGKGILKETCTGVLAGERTNEQALDVTAIGQDPLRFTIKWTDTFVSQTGECFISIPQTEVKSESTVELQARDGASKKLDHPSDFGEGYEMFTLRMEAKN